MAFLHYERTPFLMTPRGANQRDIRRAVCIKALVWEQHGPDVGPRPGNPHPRLAVAAGSGLSVNIRRGRPGAVAWQLLVQPATVKTGLPLTKREGY